MKSKKKNVLAGLALLAITMFLLPLAGCKNDTVSEGVQPTNWLTFTAEGEQSLTIKASGNMEIPDSMVYSTDGGQRWSKPQLDTAIPFGNETKLYLRAKSSIGTAKNSNVYLRFQFGTEVKVACSGDIRTLVDYTNPTGADTSNARFCYLFNDCSQLTQAPELPAAILVDWCYCAMFDGCTGLTQAPELLAETLADFCYVGMFSGCTSLTQAPELPAETLPAPCYAYMFSGCEKLKSVTMLAKTNVNVYNALYQWLDGTAEGGTLYVASGMEANEKITGGLPKDKNWKVAVAATN